MTITVSYFGPAREALGTSNEELSVPEGTTVGRLLEILRREREPLAPLIDSCRVAVGTRYAPSDEIIHPSAEIALIPPVAGG